MSTFVSSPTTPGTFAYPSPSRTHQLCQLLHTLSHRRCGKKTHMGTVTQHHGGCYSVLADTTAQSHCSWMRSGARHHAHICPSVYMCTYIYVHVYSRTPLRLAHTHSVLFSASSFPLKYSQAVPSSLDPSRSRSPKNEPALPPSWINPSRLCSPLVPG